MHTVSQPSRRFCNPRHCNHSSYIVLKKRVNMKSRKKAIFCFAIQLPIIHVNEYC